MLFRSKTLKEKVLKAVKKELEESGDIVKADGEVIAVTKAGKGDQTSANLRKQGINTTVMHNIG